MSRARRPLAALFVALLVALGCGIASAATPPSVTVTIFSDYSLDRVINGEYSAADLQAALAVAQDQGEPFREFEAAVQEVYDRDILGLRTAGGDPQTAQPPDEGSGLLPEPRGPGERSQPPWPFLAMTALGALLAVAGAGSSIYRRVHR